MPNRFGVLLRDARRRAGMTQDELAARSGVGVRTIRRLETGSGNDPRVGTVTLLADALDVSAADRRSLLAAADGHEEPGFPRSPAVERPAALPAVPAVVADAADHLARIVAAQLRHEEELRRVHDPLPLPVRWRHAPEHLTDHWDNICRVPSGVTAEPLDLSGEVGDIAGAYRRVPSRRMVVLGRAGSGKTVLTLRFVLDTLAGRPLGGAVPVIFNIGSWDPRAKPLRSWLVAMLQRDHPGLAAAAPGGATLAAVLVDTGRILPVFDGFDEIAAGLHRPAMEALNTLSTPLLLTSRFDEYERAVHEVDVLTSAAVVELTDLTDDDLGGYLPRTARRRTPDGDTVWDNVITALRDDEHAGLADVLRTPLMVGLARTVYSDSRDRDPAELLDTDRFPTERAIQEHLLDSFVPTVYNRQSSGVKAWDARRVQRWLGFLADDLDRRGTADLEWWRMGGAFGRTSRVLLVTALVCVAGTLVDWLIANPLYSLVAGAPLYWYAVLADGLLIGPVIGIPAGLLYLVTVVRRGRVAEPTQVRIRLFDRSGRQPGLRRRIAARFGAGVVAGVIGGACYGAVGTVIKAMSPNPASPVPRTLSIEAMFSNAGIYALVFGLACGVVLALATAVQTPANLTTATSPADLLAADRTTTLRLTGVLALAFGVAVAAGTLLAKGVLAGVSGPLPGELDWNPLNGLLLGVIGSLVVVPAYVFTFTAWGHWVAFSRVRLPLRGHLPWSVQTLLDDAYRRGVLRQSGAVYQFRHARLQQHLAKTYRSGR